jgi:4-amino-4-deoxy-L-arabinose transferase-like glycosyltransferase
VLAVAASIYLTCIISPPSLMDDVDAVHGQIPRTMLDTGDFVTPRIDGVKYLEKSPLIYWLIAIAYKIFGFHDWAARIPVALTAMGLALLTAAFGKWAFGKRAGFYAGLVMATGIGLWLFTRIQIPDVMLTFTITLAMWAFLRALDEEEKHPRAWAYIFAASLGIGLLLKSLVALVFPLAAAFLFLLFTRQLFSWAIWRRLHVLSGAALALLIAAPWHLLAALRNPPLFAWTLHSQAGQYHGFLWFYFINEQLLRFLNLRYPRDYNTVPRLWFWLFHLIWLFPWSVYFPAIAKLSFKPTGRAGRARLLALCWTGFLLIFFTFSTTQEYYSMPCYPALALLLGSAMAAAVADERAALPDAASQTRAAENRWVLPGTRVLGVIAALCTIACFAIAYQVRHVPAPGDISEALSRNPSAYTLSLGHMLDLTLDSFAYLRFPLYLAGLAFLIGAAGNLLLKNTRAYMLTCVMMIMFFLAARQALIVFDPYLSSRPIAEALLREPPGKLIVQGYYYQLSSIPFYTQQSPLMLSTRRQNLDYGASAPGAPPMFLNDSEFAALWTSSGKYYFVASKAEAARVEALVGTDHFATLLTSGGKLLLTNTLSPAPSPAP